MSGESPGDTTKRPERVLLIGYFDPRGPSTVTQMLSSIQALSVFQVHALNLFDQRAGFGPLRLRPDVQLQAYDALIVHNTVSYDPDNLLSLDSLLDPDISQFAGAKVLLRQDDNHEFRRVGPLIRRHGYDLVYTCLDDRDLSAVYPVDVVGPEVRFERMLTGYVTPALRRLRATWPQPGAREIDIGYRGSIQPLAFGRLSYEKRQIGEEVRRRLRSRGLRLDISSRWQDRVGGGSWLQFLMRSKCTLGVESGASVFDLDGDLDARIAAITSRIGPERDDENYAEAFLAGLATLENRISYGQVAPRHFEAAAAGTVQLMYPGKYSGIFKAGRHYVEIRRDFSNLDEVVDRAFDPAERDAMAARCYEEIVLDHTNGIEGFVARLDMQIEHLLGSKGRVVSAPGSLARIDAGSRPRRKLPMKQRIDIAAGTAARRAWNVLPPDLQVRLRAPLSKVLKATRPAAGAASSPTKNLNEADGTSGSQERVTGYWTTHNVTSHKEFTSREESREYFHWRCDQYPGYIELMPVDRVSGLDVLDYGCGPGHDLVGFSEYSRPGRLVGADVSEASLAEASRRMRNHPGAVELVRLAPEGGTLPFPDASFDYVHSSGVLHHVADLPSTLRELRRVLRARGAMRVMVYNACSVWLHLYVAYRLRLKDGTIDRTVPIRRAFALSTDGPDCPVANCYTENEFAQICREAALTCTYLGGACSLFEMQLLQALRYEACMSQELERPHREFLQSLEIDGRGVPRMEGKVAGVSSVFEMRRIE